MASLPIPTPNRRPSNGNDDCATLVCVYAEFAHLVDSLLVNINVLSVQHVCVCVYVCIYVWVCVCVSVCVCEYKPQFSANGMATRKKTGEEFRWVTTHISPVSVWLGAHPGKVISVRPLKCFCSIYFKIIKLFFYLVAIKYTYRLMK